MVEKQGKNYITPVGLARLQGELKRLKYQERPEVTAMVAWAASNGDRSENGDYIYGKKRLSEIDSRIRFLSKQIDAAVVIDPAAVTAERIQFGATVTFRDEAEQLRTYTIVGVDESYAAQGRISWCSPLAQALMNKKSGEWVTFRAPGGEQELEIVELCYRRVEY